MTDDADSKHLSVEQDGQVLAHATMSGPDEHGEARAQVHVAPGHLPVGTRQLMADAVQEAVSDTDARRLTASVPRGDTELVDGIRDQLHDVELRAAGATSIIQGKVKPD